jgi:O-antigen/teichoic acid export membrane protein
LFHLIYGDRWDAAILPFQLLSLAMAVGILGAPSVSLMRAQGRFGAYLMWSTVSSAIYLAAIGTGAWLGSAVGVAAAALGAHSLLTLLWLRNATGGFPGYWRFVFSAVGAPLLLTGAAAAAALWTRGLIPPLRESNLLGLLFIGSVMAAVYLVLVRTLLREAWDELLHRVRSAVRGRSAAGGGGARASESHPLPG